MSNVSVSVKIDMPKILGKVENDRFGLFLAQEWKRLITPYIPRRTGMLEENVIINPFSITFISPYSHYMYNGKVYADPIYNAGGFTKDDGITWFSRPGVKKIPTEREFKYSREHNPQATHHWDRAAEQAGQKRKLIQSANNYLKNIN